MPVSAETKTGAIPSREQIADQYKWKLEDLYPSKDAWEADFKKAYMLIEKAKTYAGKLATSPQVLYECLESRTELSIITHNLYQYAYLNQDLDNRVSQFQEMTNRAMQLMSQVAAAFSFIEPELLEIEESKLLEMANNFPKTDVYDFYIKELIRSRQHIRSKEVEELLAQSLMVTKAPSSIFTMLDDADLKYPSIRDEQGNEVTLTKQRYAKFLESSDPRVRKDAHMAFYSVYKEHLNTLSASLSSSVNKDIFYTKARLFEDCLSGSLFGNNIPVSVYHSLLDTAESDLNGLHKYVAVRKRVLKLDNIFSWDMICPLFPDRNYEVSYDDAVKEVLEAVQPLGTEYVNNMRHAFENRWVDVYETEGKGSGAYNWGNYSAHPFVLMNYNGTIDNMFTLAHEMGHAMHSHLSSKALPYEKSQYSIFVAEVASTLNEGLLLQHLLKKTKDTRDRLYLLNRQIDNTVGTFFNQILYARFELKIHQEVEKGGALSPDTMTAWWRELLEKYFGPHLTMDDYTPLKWSRIPHFYNAYYVYQYATSYAASQAILEKVIAGEENIIERYLELLSSGGKDYPIELLKICGVDMSTPDPVQATIKLFNEQVEELDKLA